MFLDVKRQKGKRSLYDSFLQKPTLLWYAPALGLSVDTMMDLLCLTGTILAFFMLIWEKLRNFLSFAILWMFYYSLYQAGQTFLWFQWDILLLETGFLTIFVASWSWRSSHECKPRDGLCFWLIKWLIFRLMFQSGVVKLTSECPTWWGLTALNYHYESQCIPTQLAWYAHQLPEWFQKFSVAMTFIIEIGIPFLFFLPWRSARIFSFFAQVLLQILIILTGNYNFFNLLTITLCLSLLDDQFFLDNLPSFVIRGLDSNLAKESQKKKQASMFVKILSMLVNAFLGLSVLHYSAKMFNMKLDSEMNILSSTAFTKAQFSNFLTIAVPASIGIAIVSFIFEVIVAFYKSFKVKDTKSKALSSLQTLLFAAAATWLLSISLVPYTDIEHKSQSKIWPVIHRWYRNVDQYQVANAYGLFRSMTGVGGRPELVIEGSDSLDGPWKEYHFLYKPGKLDGAPSFLIPHQPRLDWQMWFAALGSYQYNPWFISLIDKLLENKKDVKALLGQDPFPDDAPRFIKSTLYLYHFTKLPKNTTSVSDGIQKSRKIKNWWRRTKPTEYTPPLGKDNKDVKSFLLHHGLLKDGVWPETPSGFLYDVLIQLRSTIHGFDPTLAMLHVLILDVEVEWATQRIGEPVWKIKTIAANHSYWLSFGKSDTEHFGGHYRDGGLLDNSAFE
eukprot:gene8972-16613_t